MITLLSKFRGGLLAATFACAGVVICARAGAKDPAFDLRAHYTKYEYRIPMRDGVRLFTAVYVPKDASKSYPFLMLRTPYDVGPYGEDEFGNRVAPNEEFAKAGYIFVLQDVRGRWQSEGKFIEETPSLEGRPHGAKAIDESTDTHDTVDWLLKHVPNNNGRVGLWGISYLGFYTAASIIDSHPAIKAASPQAPMPDEYLGDDCYHGGAFMLAANFDFATGFNHRQQGVLPPKVRPPFDYGTEDGYEFFLKLRTIANATRALGDPNPTWSEVVEHPNYDDYWKARALWHHLKNIHCAVLNVGGWFDAEDIRGPMRVYRAIERDDPGIFNAIVYGPWVHGGWAHFDGHRLGSVDFDADTAKYYNEKILFPFFEQYLKDQPDARLAEATMFETGTNVWRQYPSWPPPNAKKQMLYFRAKGGLSWDAPTEGAAAGSETAGSGDPSLHGGGVSDSYVSDPAKPVPFIGYTATGMPQEYLVADQRFAATRPDVLVYETEPLEEDVTLAGPVAPKLFVSTTGTDSDFVVKLIDVYPPERSTPENDGGKARPGDVPPPAITLAGYQQLVRGEPFRVKFRNGFEQPEAMVPGRVTPVNFDMPDVNHTFRRGHRIMVQVQSSWFPLVDLNPQVFEDIPKAKPEDFRAATERVYRGGAQASGVEVYVLPQP
ncbi:MAG TPA: CocE/NonD family hydrolase [Opitutus sp.]|nr:CocE/NonD family hydrolase [Opitutus sp.]